MEVLTKLLSFFGIANFLSSGLASMGNVEKSAWTPAYINTHYITCITIFTAWSHSVLVTGDLYSEVFAFIMTMFGLSISATALLADMGNVPLLHKLRETMSLQMRVTNMTTEDMKPWMEAAYDHLPKRNFLFLYAVVDGVTSAGCVGVCVLLLRRLLQSRFNMSRQATSVPLLGLGTGLIVVAVLRGIIYISEIMALRGSPIVAAGFINYTIDEPSWIGMSITTGVVIVLCSRGSYLLRTVSLISCGVLIWPAMFFMWLDYRAMDMGINRAMYPFSLSPLVSITLGFMELGVLITTGLTLLQQYPTRSKVRLDASVKRVFVGFSATLLFLGFMTITLDLYAAYEHLFYRLFHGTEQKLPFLCILLAIFCYIGPEESFAGAALPICLAISILTINSSFFQILGYIWLTYNSYYAELICPTLGHESCGTGKETVTTTGSLLHLSETLFNFSVLVISACICVIITRIGRMRRPGEALEITPQAVREAKRTERIILALGVAMELQALVLFVVVTLSDLRKVAHPLISMYGYLYHVALALALVVFPLYQIVSAEDLHEQPMAQHTLLALSFVRFISILTQLDYRNTGDTMDLDWTVHHWVDLSAMVFLFLTILLVLRLMRLGQRPIPDTDEIAMDFDNPLEDRMHSESDGYVQLRPELNI